MIVSGCSNLSLSDLATGAGATLGATAPAVLNLHPAVTLASAGAGAVAGAALVGETETVADACSHVPTDQYQSCLTRFKLFELFNTLWMWAVGAVVGLMVMAWLIPGPQSLFFWRKSNAESNTSRSRAGQGWPDS